MLFFEVFNVLTTLFSKDFPESFHVFFSFGKKIAVVSFSFNLANFLCVFVRNFVNTAYINTKFFITSLLYHSSTVKSNEYTQETILEINYIFIIE